MFENGFPSSLREDVLSVEKQIPFKINTGGILTAGTVLYTQNDNIITFPYRVYYTDIPDDILNHFDLEQKKILHCIFSRSDNGFVRQKHLQALLEMDFPEWVIPYIVKPCDEYVVEILEMTFNMLTGRDTKKIKEFCLENADSFCYSYERMTSYWNEFYRDKNDKFRNYIGRKLFWECFGYSRSVRSLVDKGKRTER